MAEQSSRDVTFLMCYLNCSFTKESNGIVSVFLYLRLIIIFFAASDSISITSSTTSAASLDKQALSPAPSPGKN